MVERSCLPQGPVFLSLKTSVIAPAAAEPEELFRTVNTGHSALPPLTSNKRFHSLKVRKQHEEQLNVLLHLSIQHTLLKRL